MTMFENTYVVNVMADDRPGIVASVTGAFAELNGNVEACSQTVVEGYFTLITVVSFPEPIQPAELAQRVKSAGGDTFLDVHARKYEPTSFSGGQETEQFVLTAFGSDTPGVLHRFAEYLSGRDINIIDFYSDIQGENLVLIAQLEVPSRWDIPVLQADLREVAEPIGFTVRLQHENIFVATNQLRLSRTGISEDITVTGGMND